MNIDISNAHCGPRILFPDHSWLRVVSISKTARFSFFEGKCRSVLDARRATENSVTRHLKTRKRRFIVGSLGALIFRNLYTTLIVLWIRSFCVYISVRLLRERYEGDAVLNLLTVKSSLIYSTCK